MVEPDLSMPTVDRRALSALELRRKNWCVLIMGVFLFYNIYISGFQDSLQSLNTLTAYKFDLPIDLAVHQFLNIKDIFT